MKKFFSDMTEWEQAAYLDSLDRSSNSSKQIKSINDSSVDGTLDIRLTVNGVELNFENFLDGLDEHMDFHIKRLARRMAIGIKISDYEILPVVERGLHNLQFAIDQLSDTIDILRNGENGEE